MSFSGLASLSPLAGNQLALGGQRWTSTDIRIDGAQARNMLRAGEGNGGPVAISLEAVREFEVNTDVFDVGQGRQGGGQILNIVSWNGGGSINRVIQHELLHALGFRHEQSRLDRSLFVTINYGSIASQCPCPSDPDSNTCSCAYNFDVDLASYAYGPYDYRSVMHYGPFAFSNGTGPTITTVQPAYQVVIGQSDYLSYFDMVSVRGLYRYASDRWVDQSAGASVAGTFENPYNFHLTVAASATPLNGTLFIKQTGTVHAVGTYTRPMTIIAPLGATLGN